MKANTLKPIRTCKISFMNSSDLNQYLSKTL